MGQGSTSRGLGGGQRALLVLDGMEPLQSPHAFERGKLRDAALESLLRGLVRHSEGLCLITTREQLPDLADRPGVVTRDLEQITPQAGRALLRTARVVGRDAELEALAERFGPHALAVSLLGVYLYEQPGHGIGPAKALEQLPGAKPINRVLTGFEQWLGDSPERDALRLLGFFDRPADSGCLGALRKTPAISGLTEQLAGLDDTQWDRVLDRLGRLRLIHVQQTESGQLFVDSHPLIREHFAQVLKNGEAWREGHRRLYEHLCATTKEGDQPTLEDLQPLYQAVAHGCQAGMRQEACDEVFFARIRRGNEDYATTKLGAFGFELGAVSCFFDPPWTRVSPEIREADQAWLLSVAAYDLRPLGRLTDALDPIRAALEMAVKQEDWRNAAQNANNLSEMQLTLGKVIDAEANAEQAVTYADRSKDSFKRYDTRSALGDALYQAGRRAEAEQHFRLAEQICAKDQPAYPLLYSLGGFRYCGLSLEEAERAAWQATQQQELRGQRSELLEGCRAIAGRAAETLKWVTGRLGLLAEALNHLTLGRALLYEGSLKRVAEFAPLQRSNDQATSDRQRRSDLSAALQNAAPQIDAAVDGFRRAGTTHHIPHGLLTRAWLRFLDGECTRIESAEGDLNEAWEIAERGPMKLFMADLHLYRARLFHGVKPYPWTSPQED